MAEHVAERGPLHPQRRCSWSELFVNFVHDFAYHKNLLLPLVPVAPLVPLLCLLRLAADPQPDPGDENNTCNSGCSSLVEAKAKVTQPGVEVL